MNPQKLKGNKDIVIFADVIDSRSYDQVKLISNHPVILDPIRIMPDVHAGSGCVVGFTGKGFSDDFVIPNIIGVDIGCGVSMYPLPDEEIDFEKFDSHLRKYIPLGMASHEYKGVYQMETFLYSIRNLGFGDYPNVLEKTEEFNKIIKFKKKKDISQLGTLGGGNHFIEIDEVVENNKVLRFLVVHSGSRNFGLRVASHYQREAEKFIEKENINGVPKGLEYLPGKDYLHYMRVAQRYAQMNRVLLIMSALSFFGDFKFNPDLLVESVHNYVDAEGVIRKGAISAKDGERVIIPLNMAEGCLYGVGKGNPDFNFSAPHGAGRLKRRLDMKNELESGVITMDQYKEVMRNSNVWTSSCNPKTIDESPMAYKKLEDIEDALKLTVDVKFQMKAIYNLKA